MPRTESLRSTKQEPQLHSSFAELHREIPTSHIDLYRDSIMVFMREGILAGLLNFDRTEDRLGDDRTTFDVVIPKKYVGLFVAAEISLNSLRRATKKPDDFEVAKAQVLHIVEQALRVE